MKGKKILAVILIVLFFIGCGSILSNPDHNFNPGVPNELSRPLLDNSLDESHIQVVFLNQSVVDEDIFITVNYDVSNGNNNLKGIGINLFFDSKKVDYKGYNCFLNKGDIKFPPILVNDVRNEDLDFNTDKKINMSWASFQFPADWPNVILPVVLVRLNFKARNTEGWISWWAPNMILYGP